MLQPHSLLVIVARLDRKTDFTVSLITPLARELSFRQVIRVPPTTPVELATRCLLSRLDELGDSRGFSLLDASTPTTGRRPVITPEKRARLRRNTDSKFLRLEPGRLGRTTLQQNPTNVKVTPLCELPPIPLKQVVVLVL